MDARHTIVTRPVGSHSTPSLAQVALEYAARGWRVFPCKPRGKEPLGALVPHGLKNATTDPEQIAAWWQAQPDANIGIATGSESGLYVADADGATGAAALAALVDANGPLPPTPRVRTGRGVHYYFAAPPGGRNSAGQLGPKVDTRGEGGYVLAPPSVHPSGAVYRWEVAPDRRPLAECPVWLVYRPTARAASVRPAARPKPLGAGIGERLLSAALERTAPGCGDDTGFWLACQSRDNGLPETEALRLLEEYAERATADPNRPFCAADAARWWRSACSGTARDPWPAPGGNADIHPDARDGRAVPQPTGEPARVAGEAWTPPTNPWPSDVPDEAFYGLAGDAVRALEPHTEAHPVALLAQFLAGFGNLAGRHAHFVAESDRHYPNLFVSLVGPTAKGRKGTSWGRVKGILEPLDPAWAQNRIAGGLSSGEGLVWHVRDPIERPKTNKDGSSETFVADEGEVDKRLLCIEPELASVLRAIVREGNTLSALMRQAWDCGELRSLVKNSPARATGAHVSIIGHITADELRRYLDRTEVANGLANRFLWLCVRRVRELPDGGGTPDWGDVPKRLAAAVEFAQETRELRRDADAGRAWHAVYHDLSEGKPGLLGAVTSRAEAQVMRLALLHALLDCSPVIRAEHVLAGLALWQYAEDSARYIFGSSLGDPVADELLRALRAAPQGMTRTQIRDLFGRNRSTTEVSRALGVLLEQALARCETRETGGRPCEVWLAR
ncbi:MAG: bifunctional DNA primase/polymerase [Armatimonadetes bacterium]|nr:bifunctional DNA primase/polymerase [Armatimonadota bacterium]